jgi:hypothetical protein
MKRATFSVQRSTCRCQVQRAGCNVRGAVQGCSVLYGFSVLLQGGVVSLGVRVSGISCVGHSMRRAYAPQTEVTDA